MEKIVIFKVIVLFLSTSFISPVWALSDADNDLPRIISLNEKHDELQQYSTDLQKRLVSERGKLLEKMRLQVRETMAEWENDPEYLNGIGLKAALYNAEAVAEGHGFDVEKLNKMYRLSKKMILGLEMVGTCGEGSPHLKSVGDAVDNISNLAKGAMDIFGLADNEEERLACVQTEKLKLYREVNRAYIYALTAETARDSAEGFRQYAGYIQTALGRDSSILVKQAEQMAKDQDNVMILFELTPVVGDLIDLYRLGTGNEVLGGKVSQLDRALTGVFIFTPAIAEQLFKRSPKTFLAMKDFMKELVYPAGGFFDSAIIRSGQELAAVKKAAGEILGYMLPIGKELGTRVGTRTRHVIGESLTAITNRLSHMDTALWTREMAIEASNIIPEHMDSLLEVAATKQIVIMLRPFNKVGKKAMQEAVDAAKVSGDWIATKWMDVKPKSASNPILGAGIPVNPSLSKFDDELKEAIRGGVPSEIAEVNRKIKKMKKTMTQLFAKRDLKGNPLVGMKPASFVEKKAGGVDVEHTILWATDSDGKKVMGILNDKGELVDPLNMMEKFKNVDVSTTKEVLILTDPKGTKILPDYDTMAIGSMDKSGLGKNAAGADITNATVYVKNLGNINRRNLDAMTDINAEIAKRTGVKGNLVHHGAANAWTDLPDFPITMITPDRHVISIPEGPSYNPFLWIQEQFHHQTMQGRKGFSPDPSWGWPEYDPRFGYKTAAEKAALVAKK